MCNALAVATDVERAPNRRLADPVHHGGAGGFDVGHLGQRPGQFTVERPGHHDRQIGLQQEVVDRFGKDPVHRGDGHAVGGTGHQRPRRSAQRGAADQAQCRRLVDEIGDRPRLQPQ